jgi:hypothetical protein
LPCIRARSDLSPAFTPHFEQDSTKVVHVVKSTVLVPDYRWSQVRGSTALQPSKFYTKEWRFSAKAFDIENQLIRLDLYRKGE